MESYYMIRQAYKSRLIQTKRLQHLFEASSVQYLFVAQKAPHRAIVVSNRSGNYELHAVDFASGFHRQITKKKGGTLFGSISPDGRYVYWLNDRAGEERGNFVRASFGGNDGRGRKPVNITPDLGPYFSYSVASSDSGEVLCFMAATSNKNNVYAVEVRVDGVDKPRKIYSSERDITEPICSATGQYICVAETNERTKSSSFVLLQSKGGARPIISKSFEGATPLSFSEKSKEPVILAIAKINGWLRPIFYNFKKRSISQIDHRNFLGDVWVLAWDEMREEMILCDVHKAQQRLYMYNTRTKRLKRIGPRAGSFNFHFNSAVLLRNKSLILKWDDFNTSSRLVKIDTAGRGKPVEIKQWSGNIKSQYEVKSVSVRSSDGEKVHMWVVLPKGKEKNIPFVIDIHGGPEGVVGDEFSPEAQAWLSSGVGYCAVNYRGSIGFGKKFEKKIYGNPGHWEVEDVVAARNWLVRNQYAVAENIILYGWSWGGYVALLALGKYPELWSCGIAGGAIADCVMQYEDEPAYFKAKDRERFGGTPEAARAKYVRSSPITYASSIRTPIMLLHGKNDARCSPRQVRHFADRLKKLKKEVSIKWFESGHTGEFTDIALREKLIGEMLRFAGAARKMLIKNVGSNRKISR